MNTIKSKLFSTISLYLALILFLILGVFMFLYFGGFFYYAVLIVMFILSGYLLWKEGRILWRYSTSYMFNIRASFFDKKIERPRLFFYVFFGIMNVWALYRLGPYLLQVPIPLDFDNFRFSDVNTNYLIPIYTFVYGGSTLFLAFTWTEKFKSRFIPRIQENILKRETKEFQVKWTKDELGLIFDNLYDFDFIECDDLDRTKSIFIESLCQSIFPKEKIHLKMDHIQTYLFHKLISEGSLNFTLIFLSKIFKNKNEDFEAASISSSKSRNKSGAKRGNEIRKCFEIKKG